MKTRRRLDVQKRRTRKVGGRNRKKGNSSNSRQQAQRPPAQNVRQQAVAAFPPAASSSGPVYGLVREDDTEIDALSQEARGTIRKHPKPSGTGAAEQSSANPYAQFLGVSPYFPPSSSSSSSSSSAAAGTGSGAAGDGATGDVAVGQPQWDFGTLFNVRQSNSSSAAPPPPPPPPPPPQKSANELRWILSTHAFRKKPEPPDDPGRFASRSAEMDATADPKNERAYHKSSACGSRYEDLAARLTFALRDYDPGTPYYHVALELVTACLNMRIETAKGYGDKDPGHQAEIRLMSKLKTAIENCQAMRVNDVTVIYTYVERITRDGKKVVDGVFHVKFPPQPFDTLRKFRGYEVNRSGDASLNFIFS